MSPIHKSGRRGLRIVVLCSMIGLLALWLADRASRHHLAVTMDAIDPSMVFDWRDAMSRPLPDGAVNGTDFLEAATLIVEGQRTVYPPRDGELDPRLTALGQRLRQLDDVRGRPSDEDLEAFRAAVEHGELALAVIDQGAVVATAARYHTDYDVPPLEIQLPNVMSRRRLAFLVRARAEIALAEGRGEAAWRDAEILFRMVHWIGHETDSVVSLLVASVVADDAAKLVQLLLAEAPGDDAIRRHVLAEARRTDFRARFHRAVEIERAQNGAAILDPDTSVGSIYRATTLDYVVGQIEPSRALGIAGWRPYRRWNAAAYWRVMAEQAECRRPAYDRRQVALRQPPRWAFIARLLTVDRCGGFADRRDLTTVWADHFEIATALETIRERDGAYPPALGAAGQGLIDPFSGEPYLYQREGGGYRLWSLSANRQDDGGEPPSTTAVPRFASGDWVWRVGADRDGRSRVSTSG